MGNTMLLVIRSQQWRSNCWSDWAETGAMDPVVDELAAVRRALIANI